MNFWTESLNFESFSSACSRIWSHVERTHWRRLYLLSSEKNVSFQSSVGFQIFLTIVLLWNCQYCETQTQTLNYTSLHGYRHGSCQMFYTCNIHNYLNFTTPAWLFTYVVDFHPSGRKSIGWQGIRGHNWSVSIIYDAIQTVYFLETSWTQNWTLYRLSLASSRDLYQLDKCLHWNEVLSDWNMVDLIMIGDNDDDGDGDDYLQINPWTVFLRLVLIVTYR